MVIWVILFKLKQLTIEICSNGLDRAIGDILLVKIGVQPMTTVTLSSLESRFLTIPFLESLYWIFLFTFHTKHTCRGSTVLVPGFKLYRADIFKSLICVGSLSIVSKHRNVAII